MNHSPGHVERGPAPITGSLIVLIGGVYGSGKSTTVHLLHKAPHGLRSTIVDYDHISGDGVAATIDLTHSGERRSRAWGGEFLQAVQQAVEAHHELILVAGSFYHRERRDSFITGLQNQADLLPLYFMLPERETIAAIKNARQDENRLVNLARWRSFYQTFNRAFAQEEHTDLLLPANRSLLAPEYQALLARREENAHVLATPEQDHLREDHRWIVLPMRLDIANFVEVLQARITHPLIVWERLGYGRPGPEGSQRTPECRTQPPGQPHGFYR